VKPPVVVIVGRPNVGKSALFNRLVRQRLAIVDDVPGLTRDRLYAPAEWRGRAFTVVDTGGLVSGTAGGIAGQVRDQARRAIAEADVILFVVDARAGIVPEDRAIADVVRRAHAPVLIAANKVDGESLEPSAYEFHALGFGDPIPISALHGRGTGDLLDAVVALLPEAAADAGREEAAPPAPVAVALVGRPNVGKSSLVNAILGEPRVIVDATPGTTRDSVDESFERGGRRYVLIDTAGLRRRSRVDEPIEVYSAARARQAIDRADVAVLVLDATDVLSDQDQRIAREVVEAGRGVIIAVNKWDRVATTPEIDARRRRNILHGLRFISFAPIVATSATEGWGIADLLEAVDRVAQAHQGRIGTGPLNRVIGDAVAKHEPPTDAVGRRLRIYYATQPQTRPPVIVLFVNEPQRMPADYRRYLENAVRGKFDLYGVPLRLVLRRRGEPATA
jgi:GTP-binding protein